MWHFVFLCNLFDSYVYIIFFKWKKNCFDLKIKHVPSVYGCGTSSLWLCSVVHIYVFLIYLSCTKMCSFSMGIYAAETGSLVHPKFFNILI